jgi:acetolactate synthase-1/2/3 large subunit
MDNIFKDSKRPLILVGGGARESAAEIISFAEHYEIPIETTWNAIDLVPHDNPFFVGRPGIIATRGANFAIQECDLLLALGARLDPLTVAWDYSQFAPKAKKVMVDIDKGEGDKIPNLDLFFNQNISEFMFNLKLWLAEQYYTPFLWDEDWFLKCNNWGKLRLEGCGPTYDLMDKLSDTLPNDAIIVMGCSCSAVNIFCAGFRNKAGQRFVMSSCGLGSMGSALPVAIGAAIASKKRITMIDGDGSFMQNIQELEIVHRLNLAIDIYVICNGGYAAIHNSELRAFGRSTYGETLPDISKIARAFGVKIHAIKSPMEETAMPRVMFDGRGSLSDMWPYDE